MSQMLGVEGEFFQLYISELDKDFWILASMKKA